MMEKSWTNHGKNMRKLMENDGNMEGQMMLLRLFWDSWSWICVVFGAWESRIGLCERDGSCVISWWENDGKNDGYYLILFSCNCGIVR